MSVEDWSKPIQTRDGREADHVCEYAFDNGKSRIVVIRTDVGNYLESFYEDGGLYKNAMSDSDLINVPPRKVTREVEAWAVVDRDGTMLNHYGTEEFANDAWCLKRTGARVVRLTGTVEVEVEE